jgi:hypothetical protein
MRHITCSTHLVTQPGTPWKKTPVRNQTWTHNVGVRLCDECDGINIGIVTDLETGETVERCFSCSPCKPMTRKQYEAGQDVCCRREWDMMRERRVKDELIITLALAA